MKVYGVIDGMKVEFPHKEGDFYELQFPFKYSSGKYIVEIYAEDNAGNVAYRSTILCAIGADGVCVYAVEVNHYLELIKNSTMLQSMQKNVYLEAIAPLTCKGGI